jgi:hypothetical protein
MNRTEQENPRHRLDDLKRLLQQTTDPAAAAVISDDIADLESSLQAARSPLDLTKKASPRRRE